MGEERNEIESTRIDHIRCSHLHSPIAKPKINSNEIHAEAESEESEMFTFIIVYRPIRIYNKGIFGIDSTRRPFVIECEVRPQRLRMQTKSIAISQVHRLVLT